MNENGNDVYLYRLEKSEKLKGFYHTSNLDEVMEKSDFIISIPMKGKINSLNASVAAGIVIYEVIRQRK